MLQKHEGLKGLASKVLGRTWYVLPKAWVAKRLPTLTWTSVGNDQARKEDNSRSATSLPSAGKGCKDSHGASGCCGKWKKAQVTLKGSWTRGWPTKMQGSQKYSATQGLTAVTKRMRYIRGPCADVSKEPTKLCFGKKSFCTQAVECGWRKTKLTSFCLNSWPLTPRYH